MDRLKALLRALQDGSVLHEGNKNTLDECLLIVQLVNDEPVVDGELWKMRISNKPELAKRRTT